MNKRLITKRNAVILNLIKQGYSNPEIAEILDISKKTVENLIQVMLTKFKVKNRTELIYRALQEGILDLEDPDISTLRFEYKSIKAKENYYINNELSKFDKGKN